MSIDLMKKQLKGFDELLKSVCKLEIHSYKPKKTTFKKKEIIENETVIYSYDFIFDVVKIVDNEVVGKGRSIVVYDIKEGFVVDSISLFTLNEDKEYVKVYTQNIKCDFPNGGTFTFNGTFRMEVSNEGVLWCMT